MKICIILFVSLFVFIEASFANQPIVQSELIQQVENFVENQTKHLSYSKINITVGHLNQQLHLHECEKPLDLTTKDNELFKSKFSVMVSCQDEQPWRIFVPVTVQLYENIIVSSRTLARGSIITDEDITFEEKDITKLHQGSLQQVSEVVGKKVKNSISIGMPIIPKHLEEPILVKRNEIVQIIAGSENLRIQITGTALKDGVLGQQIPVKNTSSHRIVDAYVMGQGQVKINI